ncbi:MAG TPA: hypothetical protein DDX57_07465 [Bacteroidales bacterium]|nr:hypothetical protein [Bacteroidales bacterium]
MTWEKFVNTSVQSYVLTKNAGADGWNAGAESVNKLAKGQDGWVEFKIQEVTKKKMLGFSYEYSSSIVYDSLKFGFLFDFSGSTRVLKTKKLTVLTTLGTYDLNDIFRIEKVGTKLLFLKNGVKIDSCTTISNSYDLFVDAQIYSYGGQFHQVKTSFAVQDSVIVYPNKDARIASNSTLNFGTDTFFWAVKSTNRVPYNYRSLIQFDMPSLPANARIVNADLSLYGVDGYSPAQMGHRCETNCISNASKVYLNTATWDESTVTYTYAPAYNTSIYSVLPASPGTSYDYTNYKVDMNNLVNYWFAGTYTNYGVTMVLDNESYYYTQLQFRSSDNAVTSERPKVVIKYYIGTKYYVNDNFTSGDVFCKAVGNSGNSGLSPYSPKASVSTILSTYILGPKDTIFVDAGTYTEAITFTSADCGSSLGQLVVHGAGKNYTTINNAASNHNIYLNNADYVTIENLKLNNTQTGSYFNINNSYSENMIVKNDSLIHSGNSNIVINGNSLVISGTANNAIIQNCFIVGKSAGKTLISVTGACSNLYLSSNTIQSLHDNTMAIQINYLYSTIYSKPNNPTICNNIISVDSIGIKVNGHASAIIDKIVLINNKISLASTGNSTYGVFINYSGSSSSYIDTISGNTIISGGYGIKASYLKYAKVYNNYLVNNTNGISLTSSQDNLFAYNNFRNAQTNFIGTTSDVPTNTTLSDNIFVSTGNSSYYNLSLISGTFASCDYNCFYNPNGAKVAVHGGIQYNTLSSWQGKDHYSGTGNGDEHSISADPLYSDPVTDDLDIDLFSPCTQAGSAISGINADIYNRVRRSLPSIGANEPILFLNIPVLKNNILADEDTVMATLTGSGIDTTFFVPDTFMVYPTVPLEGYLSYEISFEGDTSLIDDSSIGFRVNSLGIIDSVYEKRGSSQYPLDPAYYTLLNLNRGIAASAIMKVLPAYTKLNEVLDGGYYIAVGRRVKFYYWEEYNVSDNPDKYLEYKIYDKEMNIIASVSSDGSQTPSNAPLSVIMKGQNKVTLNLTGIPGFVAGEYYIIEVSNSKNELTYLRFKL